MKELQNKVCVVISCCDKYLPLSDVQFHFFRKFWNTCPFKIFYITEIKPLTSDIGTLNVQNMMTNISPTSPKDWSRNLDMLLNIIDYDYIIYLQEDYIFIDFVDEIRLNKLLNYIIDKNINYVRFFACPKTNEPIVIDENLKIRKINKYTNFRSSLKLSIWNKKVLHDIVKKNIGCDPWKFEINTVNNEYDDFYCIDLDKDDDVDIIKFKDIYFYSCGFPIDPKIKDFIKKENIKINGKEFDVEIRL